MRPGKKSKLRIDKDCEFKKSLLCVQYIWVFARKEEKMMFYVLLSLSQAAKLKFSKL
jgi:hypothetical protein